MKKVQIVRIVLLVISFWLVVIAGCGQKQDGLGKVAPDIKQVNEEKAAINQVRSDLEKDKTINLGNGVTMELVLIPTGSFYMGSPSSEKGRTVDEGPVRKVIITKPFYIGKYEVTQDQWKTMMGTTVREQSSKLYNGLPLYGEGGDYPIYWVSWHDAIAFCKKLGSGFRLPTEAEWEYACRAGSDTRFHYGDDPNCHQISWSAYTQDDSDSKAHGDRQKESNIFRRHKFYYGDDPNCSQLSQYAWYGGNSVNTEMAWHEYEDDKGRSAHHVGQKKPNAWGLYDMYGNVGEWCADWWVSSYKNMTNLDPVGFSSGKYRVIRGGSWFDDPQRCRSAARIFHSPDRGNAAIGFRIVLDVN
jgi:formylglycine-generating enzyme required for sulfatase activity